MFLAPRTHEAAREGTVPLCEDDTWNPKDTPKSPHSGLMRQPTKEEPVSWRLCASQIWEGPVHQEDIIPCSCCIDWSPMFRVFPSNSNSSSHLKLAPGGSATAFGTLRGVMPYILQRPVNPKLPILHRIATTTGSCQPAGASNAHRHLQGDPDRLGFHHDCFHHHEPE